MKLGLQGAFGGIVYFRSCMTSSSLSHIRTFILSLGWKFWKNPDTRMELQHGSTTTWWANMAGISPLVHKGLPRFGFTQLNKGKVPLTRVEMI